MKSIQLKSVLTLFLFFLLLEKSYGLSQGPLSGVITSNAPIPGSTSPWGNTNNVTSSDNNQSINTIDLSIAGNYTNYLQVTGFGFTIPNSSVIEGIKVEVERSDLNSKTKDYRVRIVKNGIIKPQDKSANQFWPSTDTYKTYGGDDYLWNETWIPTDINASNFGFAIAIYSQDGGTPATFGRIDHIRITVYYSALLPVEISNFVSSIQNNKAILQWTTASELNNNYFILERSKDGIQFYSIGEVKGAGKSNQQRDYSFTDDYPLIGISYYRIKQVDYNGVFSYSSILALNHIVNEDNPYINIYPENTSNYTLALQISNIQNNTPVEIKLIDTQGKVYIEESITLNNSNNPIQLSMPYAAPSGIYIAHITSYKFYFIKKIIL